MKKFFLFSMLVVGALSLCAQDTENESRRRTKGDFVFLTAGYQIPLYLHGSKQFTDPLVGFSQQNFVFIPLVSTPLKKGFGFDFRFSYLQSKQWQTKMDNQIRNDHPDDFVKTYIIDRSATMRIWSIMAGPSYRINKGKNIFSFQLLGGFGNQPVKQLAAEFKDMGSNQLVTLDIMKTQEPYRLLNIYKNIYMASAGMKYVCQFHQKWGIFASCDLQLSQREVSYDVTYTLEHTGDVSKYTAEVKKAGFSVTPGVGLVRCF